MTTVMQRELPPLRPLDPDADVNSIRQGDRRFAARYLAMQLYEAGLTNERLRALGRVFSIKVEKAMSVEAGEPDCTERYTDILQAIPDPDPQDAVRFAGQQSLTRDERKVLHRILRRHGRVPGAREAVAVSLGLTDDNGWREQVVLHELGMRKPEEFERAARMEAEAIVTAVLHTPGLWARVEARTGQDEPHVAATAVLTEVLSEQTDLALVAADRASNARSVARDVGVAVSTAQEWVRLPAWERLVRDAVQRSYLARRAVLDGPAGIVRLWRAERTRRSIGQMDG